MKATPVVILAVVAAFVAIRLLRRKAPTLVRDRALSARASWLAPLGDAGLVAEREVRERVRGRIFQVGTVLILLVVAAAIVIPVLHKHKADIYRVGVVGAMPASLGTVAAGADVNLGADVQIFTEPSLAAAEDDLRSGHDDVVVADGTRVIVKETISTADTSTTAQLADAIAAVLGTARALDTAGLSGAQIAAVAHAKPLPVTGLSAPSATHQAHPTSVIGLILVFLMLSQYNTWILTGVVEEKSSRVVEVLLSAVRPIQLIAGKVLGIGLVALLQASTIVAFALVLAKAVGSNLLTGTAPITLVSTLAWLLLGYAFYCWVYAAAGSTAGRQEQVQSLAFPLTVPLIIGYVVSLTSATSGDASTFLKVLAYLPPTAPFAMPTLVSLGAATWWQFGASVLISIVSTVGVARLATNIYRRTILRSGRRVRLRELATTRRRLQS